MALVRTGIQAMALSWAQSYFIICELGNWQTPIQSWIWCTVMLKFSVLTRVCGNIPCDLPGSLFLWYMLVHYFLVLQFHISRRKKKSHFRCAFNNLKFLICVCVCAYMCMSVGRTTWNQFSPSMTQVLETSLSHQAWQHMPSPTTPPCCGK